MDNLTTPSPTPICPICHQPILPTYYFCPNCGHDLQGKPKNITVLAQVGVYALALFLPPFGLWPGVQYLMRKGRQAKWVGAVAIILTLLSSALCVWFIFAFYNSYLGQINNQINGLY